MPLLRLNRPGLFSVLCVLSHVSALGSHIRTLLFLFAVPLCTSLPAVELGLLLCPYTLQDPSLALSPRGLII